MAKLDLDRAHAGQRQCDPAISGDPFLFSRGM